MKVTDNDDPMSVDELTTVFDTVKLMSAKTALCDLSKESLRFLLFQSLIEIMLRMEYHEKDFDEMWNLCCKECTGSETEFTRISTLAEEYTCEKAISYYTENSCLYRLVNKALRLDDFEKIYRFGCYIADLHKQIKNLCSEQNQNRNETIKKFYRGQKFTIDVIQQLKDSVGHLVSLNGLLSTTKNYMISTIFAGLGEVHDDYQSVIFEFNINSDTMNLIRPFASITYCSLFPDEEEVLFFMGFVWKIESMEIIGDENAWYIVLQSCEDYNSELIKYVEKCRGDCTYLNIAHILRELGDYSNAANFYQRMLEKENILEELQSNIYFYMAELAEEQERDGDAEDYYKRAYRLRELTISQNRQDSAPSKSLLADIVGSTQPPLFNNMAELYKKMGKSEKAREYFGKALQEKGLSIDRAKVLNNAGLFECSCRNDEKARQYLSEAVELAQNDPCYSEFKRNLDFVNKCIEKKAEHKMQNLTLTNSVN